MKLHSYIVGAILAVAAFAMVSCEDTTQNIGSDLIQVESDVVIAEDFKLESQSVTNDRVQSRSITQLIGTIDSEDYGRLTADFVTQFMPADRIDTLLQSSADIDSVKLIMMYPKGAFVGDSVIPMGLEVYRLKKQLTAPIFSDFNPKDYYNPSVPLGSKIYGASNFSFGDTLSSQDTYNAIYVNMPLELGKELFDLYKAKPEVFLSPTAFAQHFPGIYVRNSYGNGRVTRIGATGLGIYYHYSTVNAAGRDTILNTSGVFFQATPEIISNNNISYTMSPDLQKRFADGQKLVVAPAGLDVEIKFPLKEIISYYREHKGMLSVINSLTMSIPVEKISNTYGIDVPNQLLLIKKSERQKFFEKSQITDNLTSFYSSFSTSTGSYNFNSLRNYFIDALNRENELTEEDFTFILTPVVVQTEQQGGYYQTTEVIKSIVPYIEEPVMARLMTENAKIKLTFSNQNQK